MSRAITLKLWTPNHQGFAVAGATCFTPALSHAVATGRKTVSCWRSVLPEDQFGLKYAALLAVTCSPRAKRRSCESVRAHATKCAEKICVT
jgi:hypothetical protein